MPEGMNVEVAHTLSEGGEPVESDERRHWTELAEILEVIVLALVAIATAWSGYQAARWDGRQAYLYGTASRMRIEADEALTLGGQQKLLDVTTFNTWIDAQRSGDEKLAALYIRRFSPEFKVAFDAWVATDPANNPDAPPGPSFMPEYVNPGTEKGQELNDEASATFDEGTEARENADRYVRQTVLLATVLFLVAIAQRFKYRAVRMTAAGIAVAVLILAVSGIVTLPRI
ncbi:MAG: hypothetical protein ACXWE5_13325 [Actinomycetota bacterium]